MKKFDCEVIFKSNIFNKIKVLKKFTSKKKKDKTNWKALNNDE